MKILGFLVAIFGVIAGITGLKLGYPLIELLAITCLVCAFTTYRASQISSFLKIFAGIFAAETVIFGTFFLFDKTGFWPASLAEYTLPESLPLTVALFAILVYAVSFIPVIKTMTRIADRYFDTRDETAARIWPLPGFRTLERRVAVSMIVFLVCINQAQVGMEVRLSFFSRDWFNAIQNKDEKTFWYQLFTVFLFWAFLFIASAVLEYVVQSNLVIRWRRWLTDHYTNAWLKGHRHYHMSLAGFGADNPDQRIAEDVNRFIEGGEVGMGIYSFTIILIAKLSSLVSFAVILWDLSANFTLPYTAIAVPGFLFWVALLYAGIGTIFTHLIGRPLVALSFKRQRYEADFRFSLARLREYSEQIALLKGEAAEQRGLSHRFGAIMGNYFEIISCRKKLTAFTASYGQVSPFIPYIVAAPFYFAGKITLGIMTQTASAFSSVNSALTFFVTYYVSLAEFKSVLDRLTSFDQSIDRAEVLVSPQPAAPVQRQAADKNLSIENLSLHLPDQRLILENLHLDLKHQEPVLFSGPSGSGKSTLFRAVAGIWPYKLGGIALPDDAKVMLLPQRPYLPIGTLRAAATYPAEPGAFDDQAIRDALIAARLEEFAGQLDVEDFWSQRLSGGEQQRLAIARALLVKPDWLFLDEATSAMDEDMEAEIYSALENKLPGTTLVSIGHRTSLIQFHKRRFHMQPAGKNTFTPGEIKATAAQ